MSEEITTAMRRKPSKRTVLIAAGCALAMGLAFDGVGVDQAATRQAAHDAALAAEQRAAAVTAAYQDTVASSTAATTDLAALTEAAATIQTSSAGAIPEDSRATLATQVAANQALLAETPDTDLPAAVTAVDDTMSTEEYGSITTALQSSQDALDAAASTAADHLADLQDAITATEKALVDAATASVPQGAVAIAAAPLATQATKDAVTAAGAALTASTARADVLAALTGHIAAVKALSDSQVAEAAAAAAAAEAEAAAQQGSSSRGGSGSSSSGGGRSSGGAGSSSGGGGSSSSSSSGGGSSSSPSGGGSGGSSSGGGYVQDTRRYVRTNSFYVPLDQCNGTPAGTHDPGPGGTSIVTDQWPWSYSNEGTYIQFYVC